ncbi:zinc finger and BTB domain-containing protein 11 isoform X3 [Pleurodeles waltl]|uniref:zinc finger and BTB domain-containing protein 11 isoform X3 n=1 Tax=Pleurodeles waltl TaxID=8319 RepID=UPI003709569C
MSSEESYLAILRYLTDHKQPYAPGTTGNAKRKIRKAAACYVARGDTLYYQRRLRGRQRFCELEVVLPRERRLSLICAAHRPVSGARHRTRLQTWQHLSQRYWWRGILKEVKDYIKECDKCQEKNDQVLTLSDASSIIEDLGIEVQMCENPYDSDEVSCNPTFILPPASKPTKKRMIAKHEFIFIDSKGSVKKTSSKHSKTILNLLNQQRLANQFCDVTLLIEGEEYKAHKAVLAASSEYFRELFIEKGAVSSHEAVVDLSAPPDDSLMGSFCVNQREDPTLRNIWEQVVPETQDKVAKKLIQRGRKLKLPKRNKMEIKMHAKHKCTDCGLVFQRPYALMLHTLKHEQTKEFKCPLCKKEFQYRASLRAHLIRHSQRSEEHASVVYSRNGPARNSAKSRTKREFICDVCGRTLPKLYSLKIHMLKHTGVKPHACKVCGKSFTYKHGLKMHRTLHEVNKQFKCELCEKSFVTKRSLQEHTSLHTGESKYLCSVCGQSFHRASGLSKHVKKHQPKPDTRRFQCTQCDKCFYEARDLRQHMNKHLGVKPFQCQVCGKCYSWKKDWYSHVKSHSVTDPYRCIVCGKEFFEKALFRRHVKKATHGKKGRAKQNLQHVCEHCGKKFMQLREYRRHINNHEGVKPFECLTCGVAWADARSLKRHVRTHTGERPYVCPVCNDAYIDARTLRKHMTKCHNDYVPCKIVLEKDTLQFHNQGTQVEHAISMLSADVEQYESEIVTEEIDSVSLTGGGAHEAIEAVAGTEECTAVSTLSDQSIMQVVNYVLAQKQGQKVEASDAMEIVEAELIQASDTERVLRQKCKP